MVNKIFFIITLLIILKITTKADYIDSIQHLIQNASVNHKAELYNKLGLYYSDAGQLDNAITFFNHELTIFQKLRNDSGQTYTYLNLSEVYLRKGEYENALRCTRKSLEIALKYNYTNLERQYNQFGYIYSEWGQYDKSVEYYTKSLEIARIHNNKETEAAALNNIGYVHKLWKNYDLALSFFTQTYAIDSLLQDTNLIACDMNNIAYILRCQKKYNEAITKYKQAIKLCNKMNFIYEKALAYNGLGSVLTELNRYHEALQYLKNAVNLFMISQNENYLAGVNYNIGKVFRGMNKPDSALFYFFKSLQLAKKMNIQDEVIDAIKSIAETYYDQKKYDKAYEYQQLYNAVYDSVFNLKKHRQLAEFQGKFELDKKNNQINQLTSEQQKSKALIKLQWLLVILSFLFLITMGLLAFWLFKKYRQHKYLNEFLTQQKESIELKLKQLENNTNTKAKPYASSTLTNDNLTDILNRLQTFLNETLIYLNNELTLPVLSSRMGIPVHHLSQAINAKTGLNFNDYINSLRIRVAKERLPSADFQHFTIEAIGLSVGFNNKTTFISAFKKFENKTPSEFKKTVNSIAH